jgi:hypothetical protein
MHQQLWGYRVEEKIYLGVRERERLNIAATVYYSEINSTDTFKGAHNITSIPLFVLTDDNDTARHSACLHLHTKGRCQKGAVTRKYPDCAVCYQL